MDESPRFFLNLGEAGREVIDVFYYFNSFSLLNYILYIYLGGFYLHNESNGLLCYAAVLAFGSEMR
jgi:hypothetical protein